MDSVQDTVIILEVECLLFSTHEGYQRKRYLSLDRRFFELICSEFSLKMYSNILLTVACTKKSQTLKRIQFLFSPDIESPYILQVRAKENLPYFLYKLITEPAPKLEKKFISYNFYIHISRRC